MLCVNHLYVCMHTHFNAHSQINRCLIFSVHFPFSLYNERRSVQCRYIASTFGRYHHRLSHTHSLFPCLQSVISVVLDCHEKDSQLWSQHAHVLCNMLMCFLVLSKCSVFRRCDYDAVCLLTHTQYPQSTSPAVCDCVRYPAVFCMALSLGVVCEALWCSRGQICMCVFSHTELAGVACCFVAVLYQNGHSDWMLQNECSLFLKTSLA